MTEDLGRADVERIAALARLRLTEEEIARFSGQLARILAYADAVRGVDTTDVPPTFYALDAAGEHTREDHTAPSLPREEALAAAPDADRENGLFRVPRVL